MSIRRKTDEIWELIFRDAWHAKTGLVYDFRTAPGTAPDTGGFFVHLPTPEEIARSYPNPCGWGTGMEDSMINGSLMLEAVIYRYDAERDETMRDYAGKLLQGIRLCATVSPDRGFLARSVSPADGVSHYPESSRDQYTHCVYALYRYLHSALCTGEQREWITDALVSFAERAERNVTPETGFDYLREDGGHSFVMGMWGKHIWAHEVHRLPMLYLAAYDASGDSHWLEKYRSIRDEGFVLTEDHYAPHTLLYGFLQMQTSLRLLYDLESEPLYKNRYLSLMQRVAGRMDEYPSFPERLDPEEVNRPFALWRDVRQENWGTIDGLEYRLWTGRWDSVVPIRNAVEVVNIIRLCPGADVPERYIRAMDLSLAVLDGKRYPASNLASAAAVYWDLKRMGADPG